MYSDTRHTLQAAMIIALLFICGWITFGVWHASHQPPLTAKQQFVESCGHSYDSTASETAFGVANVDVTPWICTIPRAQP